MRISAAIITLDEERNIGRCLESLRGVADEIVVLDSGSKDATGRIAAEAGARFLHQPWLGYGAQKNAAADLTAHEWVLSLDADEALSEPLRAALLRLKAQGPGADAYEVSRLNWYVTGFLRHSGMYPDRKVRLWRKGAARWSDTTIHETVQVEPGARVERLEGDVLHYTCMSREQHLRTIERFSTLAAERLHRAGKDHQAWKRLVSPPVRFLRMYLAQGGWLDGRRGFDYCRLSAYGVWLRYDKLRALGRRRGA